MVALVMEKLFPYLIAFVIGMGLGVFARGTEDAKLLGIEKLAHAQDLQKVAAAAALADEKALTDQHAQEGQIATLDAQFTKEKQAHEADTRTYAAALAAGTQRMRIAVTGCTARGHDVSAAPGAASVDDGPAAVADIAPATASGLVTYAGDDQRELDKLKALQAYVCSIRADLPACAAPTTGSPH